MCEDEAVRALKNGDMSGFAVLYKMYAKPALRTAYLVVYDLHTAEDILQDAFLQCLASIHSLKDDFAFKPWFYKILIRLAYKAAKKSRRTVPCEDIYNGASACDKYPSDNEFLYECIKRLKPKQRTATVLFYYCGMSIKEISAVMRCPQGTVKSRLNSAKRQLKCELEKEQIYG